MCCKGSPVLLGLLRCPCMYTFFRGGYVYVFSGSCIRFFGVVERVRVILFTGSVLHFLCGCGWMDGGKAVCLAASLYRMISTPVIFFPLRFMV